MSSFDQLKNMTDKKLLEALMTSLNEKNMELHTIYGKELDRRYPPNPIKKCESCNQTMAWSPRGYYCANQECREFMDDGITC